MGAGRGPSKALFFSVAMLGVALVFLATLVGGSATPRTLGGRDRGVGASLLNLALGDGDGFHTSIDSQKDFSIDSPKIRGGQFRLDLIIGFGEVRMRLGNCNQFVVFLGILGPVRMVIAVVVKPIEPAKTGLKFGDSVFVRDNQIVDFGHTSIETFLNFSIDRGGGWGARQQSLILTNPDFAFLVKPDRESAHILRGCDVRVIHVKNQRLKVVVAKLLFDVVEHETNVFAKFLKRAGRNVLVRHLSDHGQLTTHNGSFEFDVGD
jgi:hypothetical protein